MKNKIELRHKIINDEYTKFVYDSFDIQNQEESVVTIENNINLDFDFNIGVIYGGSGTGKTTILKQFGELSKAKFDNNISLISNFNFATPKEACLLLSSMGLSSVPTWLRPYDKLSNGEQYRAHLAYCVGKAEEEEIILIDEYTSVVDRDVAMAMSNALQKYIRSKHKKIILASCHFDIMPWLQPDWVYSPIKRRLEKAELVRQPRPKIELQIFRCRYETWNIFKPYHYLTEDLNKAAKCFLTMWNEKPVAFNAVLPFPHGHIKNAFRMSRSVVLPDYQGIGIGSRVSDYIASLYKKNGNRFYTKTSNPALWNHREKSGNWKLCTEINDTDRIKKMNKNLIKKHSEENRSNIDPMKLLKESITKSFEYIGPVSQDSTDIINFSADAYKNVSQNQISLFD